MATLILEQLPPGASAVLCDNLRRDGQGVPLAVRSVVVPASGIVQLTSLPDSNYSLLFTGARNVRFSRFSIDVGDRSRYLGAIALASTSGSISDEQVKEGARRAMLGFDDYGIVQHNVPVEFVAANTPGINSSGLLVPTQVQGSGPEPETMFHTGNTPSIGDVQGLQQALDDRVTDLELDAEVEAKVDAYLAGKETTVEDLSPQLDGSTKTVLLKQPFVTLHLYLNGLLQREGAGNDFVVEASPPNQAITFGRALKPTNSLIAEYTTT